MTRGKLFPTRYTVLEAREHKNTETALRQLQPKQKQEDLEKKKEDEAQATCTEAGQLFCQLNLEGFCQTAFEGGYEDACDLSETAAELMTNLGMKKPHANRQHCKFKKRDVYKYAFSD